MTSNLLTPDEKIPVTIEDEVRRSYLDYAMSVIIGRALPDVRDGLKPVHRRCLYGMWEQGNLHNKPYRKSARIVGDVLGKYHPHGESAVYDSVVRMAQEFSLRYPLVDGQGNFGSIDGDNAAAMRYTEVRLTRLAAEMLGEDIDKETVDWTPNYDGSLVEPTVLPAKFPNLLVNGSTGIAVGMATNIPPHNLAEVVDATVELIKHPDATLAQLMKKLPGPDFPTAGFIHGAQGIRDAYKTGRGHRPGAGPGHRSRRPPGATRKSIVVTEIPYQVNKAKLIERIAELVNDKKIEGIADLRDESNREGMRIVVELKRGENAQVILNKLYALTPMQSTFGIIFLAIVENQPRVLPLHDLLRHFIDHRKTVVIRRTQFDLKKAEERAHLLRGLALALANLDQVIKIIRGLQGPQGGQGPPHGRGLDDAGGPREVRRDAALEEAGPRPRARGPAARRHPGPGDPRHAPAAADRARAREDRRRVQGSPGPDREAARDPGLREARPRHHRRGARSRSRSSSATSGARRSWPRPRTSTSRT